MAQISNLMKHVLRWVGTIGARPGWWLLSDTDGKAHGYGSDKDGDEEKTEKDDGGAKVKDNSLQAQRQTF